MTDARFDEAASEAVKSVLFRFYTEEEVRKLSVKKISKPDLYDAKNAPVLGGLYDPALGPLKEIDSCRSCGQLSARCPGHCGHIDLAKPLYHPLLFQSLKNLLQVTCFHCHNFRIKKEKVSLYAFKLKSIIKGDIKGAKKLDSQSCNESLSQEKRQKRCSAEYTDAPFSSSKKAVQQTFTSLQYSEAMSVLNKFMREKLKKCANCGRKNPTISSPTFGWLSKDIRGSDVRANIIRGSNLGLSSTEGDTPHSGIYREEKQVEDEKSKEDVASLTDEELSVPAKSTKKTKRFQGLPPEIIEQVSSSGKKHLLPSEVELILKDLWKNEAQFCMLMCDIQHSLSLNMRENSYAMFLLKVLLVPPSKFRPPAGTSGRGVLEHPQNVLLSKVQEANISLRNVIANDPDHPDIVPRWMDLQKTVNVLYDSSKGFGKSDKETSGIRQYLEKKDGILRQKIMGKRVNHACRSVISPDPYLAVNEIGIPPYFAERLTYPERVTPWNVCKLRDAVINGTATHYKDKDRIYKLQSRNMRLAVGRKLPTSQGVLTQTCKGPESEFEGKIVYRHLQDGDVVLVNRQPTLHKPSMMAHVVRVLKGEKTIRMHYANCSTYNADFDGDEMNVHFPQDEISRAEALNIVNANKQYIVPTSGDPIRGLIQDHIVSAVLLTMKDRFLTCEEYHQLLHASCVSAAATSSLGNFGQKVSILHTSDDIRSSPPAIWKPKRLWTGKQVLSAILCHITKGRKPFTMVKDGRIPKEYFGKDYTERSLSIYNNEFIHGMIDKAQFGKYGLVHIVHELYGADTAGTLLSVFSRLFTLFLQMHGFSCGVDDLLIVQDSDLERKRILEKSEVQSEEVHVRFIANASGDIDQMNLQKEIERTIRSNGESATARLDRMMSSALNLITSEANNVLFPEGLLKPFPRNSFSLMTTTGAKGGLVNMTQISSLLGQQELEGKRVPRMVSGKTLPCFPPWDISSRAGGFISDRFLTGLRPQEYFFHCMAGRDGLVDTAIKTSRSGYLQRCLVKNLESLKVCYDLTVRDADGSVVQFMYGEDGVDVLKTSCLSELEVLATNHRVVLENLSGQVENAHFSTLNGLIKDLPEELKEKTTAYVRSLTKNQKNQRGSLSVKRKDMMKLMKLKYLSSLAEPGEPVGVIAAQSVGEPSTQMTLNTFHFAGRGEMNVTLGIPRLQEILMNAKENIRTPVMTCPLLDGRMREDAEQIAAKLRRVTVADVVESMEVCTMPFSINNHQVSTVYKLKMKLFAPELYPPHSEVTLEACEKVLKLEFVDALDNAIAKHLEMISRIRGIGFVTTENNFAEEGDEDESKKKGSQGADDGGGDDNDDEEESVEDQGADAEKRKRQVSDEMEYDEDVQKETPAMTDMHDGEPQSGLESENDQVEPDEDYTVGGEDPSVEPEVENPESASKFDPALTSVDDMEEEKSQAKNMTVKGRKKKINRVFNPHFEKLRFEVEIILRKEPHILLAEIAQQTAKKVFVKTIDSIERCSVVEPKKNTDPIMLQTAGVNFLTFWKLEEYLDINKVVTNDIYAMLNTYGVEAARATIINEVKAVFEAYGIRVNMRHLTLIADFMTLQGGYRPMNRLGMEHFGTSPFGKMTFETATRFIIEAANHGEVDTLECPSASVCLGQPVKMGTGCFDLLQNLHL